MAREYSKYETAPFCATNGSDIEITLRNGDGELVTGYVTPSEARSLTLGLRATASDIDDRDFFAGGWSKSRVLEAISEDYTRLVEGDGSKLLSE